MSDKHTHRLLCTIAIQLRYWLLQLCTCMILQSFTDQMKRFMVRTLIFSQQSLMHCFMYARMYTLYTVVWWWKFSSCSCKHYHTGRFARWFNEPQIQVQNKATDHCFVTKTCSSEYNNAMKVNTKLMEVLKFFAKSDVQQLTKFVQVLKVYCIEYKTWKVNNLWVNEREYSYNVGARKVELLHAYTHLRI